MMICFVGTLYVTEKYLMNHEPHLKIYQVIGRGLLVIVSTGIMIALIPVLFPMMIYVSIIVASFICTYCRHILERRKEIY